MSDNTKGVIRSRQSKQNRQHNGPTRKDKMPNNDLLKTPQITKVHATRTPL